MKYLLKILLLAVILGCFSSCEFEEVPLNVAMVRGYWKAVESDTYVDLYWSEETSYGCDIWQWNGVKNVYVMTESYSLMKKDSLSLCHVAIVDDAVVSTLTFTILDHDRMLYTRSAPNRLPISMECERVPVLPGARAVGQEVVSYDFSGAVFEQ